jgi:2-hydroxymuconate-semialdehyde hydrolase
LRSVGRVVFAGAIGLAILFFIGRCLSARRETQPRAEVPWGDGTTFLATASGRVHLLDVGEGDVILLLHGSGHSVADWQEGLAEGLTRRGHRVVAFDDYGFGLSDREHGLRYGNALWTEQAIDVLDALGVERVVAVGHSAGGVVAACLAADHAERVRGAVFTGHGLAMAPDQIVPFLPGLGELWAGRRALLGDVLSERHRLRQEAAYRIRGTRAAFLTFVRRQYTIDGLRLLGGTYEDIPVPVLQVHGALDATISVEAARRLTRRLRDARLVVVEKVGHHVHAEAPDRLAEEITAFAAGLGP